MTWNRLSSIGLVLLTCTTLTLFATARDDVKDVAEAKPEMKKPSNPVSYYIGLSIGEQLRSQGLLDGDVDVDSLAMGIMDELSKTQPRLSPEELQATQTQVVELMQRSAKAAQEQRTAEMQATAVANQEKADLFLEENKKKEGIKELSAGVQYKVERAGNGPSPTLNSTVKVHYTGTLLNGDVFDSSVKRGQPAEFPINGLIDAWKMALPKMKIGDKWTLYVPPSAAYGMSGSPPTIGPNELLIFEMELLDIVK
jgi:FKBP-type peptidyl-prolyl cis-trans isomerase